MDEYPRLPECGATSKFAFKDLHDSQAVTSLGATLALESKEFGMLNHFCCLLSSLAEPAAAASAAHRPAAPPHRCWHRHRSCPWRCSGKRRQLPTFCWDMTAPLQ